jgi:hypothetical protein
MDLIWEIKIIDELIRRDSNATIKDFIEAVEEIKRVEASMNQSKRA